MIIVHYVFYRRGALLDFMEGLESVLPVRQELLDMLAALDTLVLQGSLLLDLSIIANIPANILNESNYGENTTMSVLINSFESAASFGSESFSLELPIFLPSGSKFINFNLTDASFAREISVRASHPIDILELFSDDKDSASVNLEFNGTFKADMPLMIGVAGVNIEVDLIIIDANLFQPDPVIRYAINMCDVYDTMLDLFENLKRKIVAAIRAPFPDKPIMLDIDRLTDPLIRNLDYAMGNFTKGMNISISSADCSRRLVEVDPIHAPGSVVRVIKDGIASLNTELDVSGIIFASEVTPYFNVDTFSIGVTVTLSATFEQTAAEVIDVVSDYIEFSTDISVDSSLSKLGFGNSGNAPVIDLNEILSHATVAAGLDVIFGIDFSLAEIQDGIFTSYPLGKALRRGTSLHIDTWGAFAEIIVNPIDLDLTLFGKDIHIRDSHFATAAEIRSRGKFVASIDDMIVGSSAINTAPLIPDLTVPLSTEFILDIPVTDGIVLSPIMSVENENLIESDFVFDLDVDIGTFLNNDYVGENTLTSLLQTAIIFLQQVSALELEVNATADSVPSSLTGFFNMVNELDDLADEFLTYLDLVNEGKELL